MVYNFNFLVYSYISLFFSFFVVFKILFLTNFNST